MLKNTMGYFPRNLMEAEKAMLDGYLMRTPCIISLKKDGHLSYKKVIDPSFPNFATPLFELFQ